MVYCAIFTITVRLVRMQVNELFSDNIKRLRGEKGFTQQQLADLSGITIAALRGYENLRRAPPMETMGKIARALGVRISDLFETGEPAPTLVLPVSKALQKMMNIPDIVYERAEHYPPDHEVWDMLIVAMDDFEEREKIRIAKEKASRSQS